MYDDNFWHEQLSAINKTGDLLLQTWRLGPDPVSHVRNLNSFLSARGDGINAKAGNLIDFGCGTGQMLFLFDMLLNPRNDHQHYGINLHNALTWEKNALNYGWNVHLSVGDITDPDVMTKNSLSETKFVFAMCNYTLGHLPYPGVKTFLSTVYKCLEGGGLFLMWDIAPASHAFNEILGYQLRHPSDVVRELQEAGFLNIRYQIFPCGDYKATIAESAEAVMSKADISAFKTRTLPILYLATKPNGES